MSSFYFCLIIVLFVSFMTFVGAGALITLKFTDDNDGIHLAVRPKCGPLSGNMSDVNAGVDLDAIKTIVSFGVSIFQMAARLKVDD
jgi:hypothetical protein